MRKFLIWTKVPHLVSRDLRAKLEENHIWFTRNVYVPKLSVHKIRTRFTDITITDDESYVAQDGLHWDDIFIMEDNYPHILDYRTSGEPVEHVKTIKYVVIDKILDAEMQGRVGRGSGKSEYVAQLLNKVYGNPFCIKDVIFNDPATIVFWTDGTKTVVKCQDGDAFDPEKGLAMAISKKALGNKHAYYHDFLHWLKKYEKKNVIIEQEALKFGKPKVGIFASAVAETTKAFDEMTKAVEKGEPYDINSVIGYLGEVLED